jgi:hypothetical protein
MNRVDVPARQVDGFDSLESIPGLLKSFKIPSPRSLLTSGKTVLLIRIEKNSTPRSGSAFGLRIRI